MFKVRGLILSFICVLCVPGFVSAVEQQQSAGLSRQMKRLHEYERLQRVLEESNPKLCEQFVPLSEKSMTRAKLAAQDKKAIGAFLDKVEADLNLNQQDKKAIAQFLRSGLSTGAKVGIGLGSAAAMTALIAMAVVAARSGISRGMSAELKAVGGSGTGSAVGSPVPCGAPGLVVPSPACQGKAGAAAAGAGMQKEAAASTAGAGAGSAGTAAGASATDVYSTAVAGGNGVVGQRIADLGVEGSESGPAVPAGGDADQGTGSVVGDSGSVATGAGVGAGSAAGAKAGEAVRAEVASGDSRIGEAPAGADASVGAGVGDGSESVVTGDGTGSDALVARGGARATAGVGAGVVGIAGEGTVAGAGKFVSSGRKVDIFLLDDEVQGLSLPLNYEQFKMLACKYPFDGRNDCYNHAQYGPLVIQKQAVFLVIFVTKKKTLGIYPIGRVDNENNIKYFRKSVDDYIIKEYLNGGNS